MSFNGVSGDGGRVSVEDSQKLPFMKRSVYVNVPFSPNIRVKIWVVLLVYPVAAAFWGIFKLVNMFSS